MRALEVIASDRLIPAHAGKTTSTWIVTSLPRAHPRACGENRGQDRASPLPAGSSPRMRGKPIPELRWPRVARLIPAHAGKTYDLAGKAFNRWAHPRACGENGPFASHPQSALGSSPRMRGKLDVQPRHASLHGLIPAHAGKTSWSRA